MTETNPLVQSAPKGSNPAARTKVQIASDFNTSEIVRRLGSVLRGSPPPEWTPVGIAVRANENFEALREQLAELPLRRRIRGCYSDSEV